jgi:hypothetical protein
MLKGIPHEDAALAAQAGIDAIIVSNHGGRFGDLVLLKEIRRAHRCFEALVSGQVCSVAELATIEGISDRYISSLGRWPSQPADREALR